MKKIATALIALAVSFSAGWFASTISFANKQMINQIAGQKKDETDIANNIALRHQADIEQQNRVEVYNGEKERGTMRTDDLLKRVLDHFDGMQLSTYPTPAEIDRSVNTNTCGAEKAKTSELSRQLRSTLETYGREAQRSDENTRLLNLCITELESKEKLLQSYR